MIIECDVISLQKKEVVRQMRIDKDTLANYYKRIQTKKNVPQTEIIVPTKKSGFALDNLGLLQKSGEFIFNEYGKLIKIEKPNKETEKIEK
jgi:hypothetical protein